ncbi:unknown seed protein like 1 [Hibiscus trionum]|uniref:BURP domain-containing protein n=1 Tax=Hibiscus trionum TaxID=183268 RepID=A0A9W7IJU3_HIBTR|nr:unknown seed protein like 1 [Hibiscus trionum]
MGNEVVYCSCILLLLLLVEVGGGVGVSMEQGQVIPWIKAYSLIKDLDVGNTWPFYFPPIQDPTSLEFFPEDQIRDIPFSSEALPQLLRFFSLSPDSPQARAIKQTLEVCESEPEVGEVSHCATSVESLIDFARQVFGSDRVTILRSPLLSDSTPPVQNYTVLESKEIWTGKMIPCHYQPYPYAVYHCHFELVSGNKAFIVSLRGDNGDTVTPVFICHVNTSSWDANYVGLRALGRKPGESELCHLLPAKDQLLLPK